MKSLTWTLAAGAVVALGARGEKPQEQTGAKADSAAF